MSVSDTEIILCLARWNCRVAGQNVPLINSPRKKWAHQLILYYHILPSWCLADW
ncbi:hypothetical protein E2C01_040859 [Portunus trituberculatus]|uniref:Uncharacterized protein n=1 Tax=Portunus trituberculatus TaxID=210409 RepID=A0A5B7FRX7_PORTR|nr:hypothetical protein [Portunus trituberculatus]